MNILFLTNRPTANTQAATVTEYLDALHKYSGHTVHEISMLRHFPDLVDLDRFDVVITHYSLSLGPLLHHYLGPKLVERLKRYKGLKAAFLQDEYREIQTYWKHINELGIDVLFSCVPGHEIAKVYPPDKVPKLRVENVLTGYVPERLVHQEVLPVDQRPIDVGYRTRRMPFWLGRLGQEKWFIAEEFKRRAEGTGLKLDLSTREGERLYGDAWSKFVASCRAVIGVESGASIIDFDGKLEHRVEAYTSKYPDATFEEVSEKFLGPFEGSLNLHQISPRCFEAAALRTPMVLFEGEYSGVLTPERHFIVLKKDFSNFDEVIAKLRDHSFLQAMADRTYAEIALDSRWSYRAFIKQVDDILEEEVSRRATLEASRPYTKAEFNRARRLSVNYYLRRKTALFMQSILLGMPFSRKSIFWLWEALPRPLRRFARPLARTVSR
ncbi:glycosyltransferase [Sedimenticola hydrogenitrophicus]|uniref:glycosyltransferase n=1 Tax=Sedimenticola hydrogenitrophicus TaxID=2967975 RepID=UPI0021A836FD|nr:glycosyltransferase [Sedimenticola hydrogenitrophicus]